MEVQTETDPEPFQVQTPKVEISKKKKFFDKSSKNTNEIFTSLKRNNKISIIEPLCLKSTGSQKTRFFLGIETRTINSPVRVIHDETSVISREDRIKRAKCSKSYNKKPASPQNLSISGKLVKNKDWISLILLKSDFIGESCENEEKNSVIRSNPCKSLQKISINKARIRKGRSLFSPKRVESKEDQLNKLYKNHHKRLIR
jgi:hypothetical protein